MLSLKNLRRSVLLKWYIAFKIVQAAVLIKLYRDRKKKGKLKADAPVATPGCDNDLCSIYRNGNYGSTKDDWTIKGGLA